jgi:hypothetical protein
MTSRNLLPAKVTISPDALYEDLDGKIVILNFQKERYYTLDEVGSDMWKLFSEKNNTEEVLNQLLEDYDVDEEKLINDLSQLISKLSESGLVTIN